MWITPFAQVNVSMPARIVTVIFGLLLANHILFVQEYTVFINRFPGGSLLESRTDEPSHCNRQQQNKVLEGLGVGLYIVSKVS